MCSYGDTVPVRVRIPTDLGHKGHAYWKYAQIDRCIALIVESLQMGGIDMRGSCCGHGKCEGDIHLQDGRVLLILSPEQGNVYMAKRSREASIDDWLEALGGE